ncbi:MAG: hypothetical protein ACM3KE_05835 [Hyphomicrobiales bacterium]
MADIDINKLAYRVKRRLDEVFPDSDDASEARKQSSESFAYAVSRMRSIAGALQWRVPLRLIQSYEQELAGIRPLAANDQHLVLLIKVQSELCRHMLDRRHKISPRALLLLLKGFTTMERITMDHGLSTARRRELVVPLVKAHLAFKQSLAPSREASIEERVAAAEGPNAISRRRRHPASPAGAGRPSAGGLERKAYYLIPVDNMEELRSFIQAGFEELGLLISQRKSR